MKKLKELLSENISSKTVKDFKFSKDELEFLQALINGAGSGQHPYADMGSIGSFKIAYVNQLMKKVKNKVPTKWKSLYNKVSTKLQETNIKEAKDTDVSDLDATLPNMVEKFLEKLISQLKGYNLNRKKQVAVIAKVINGLGMDKMELMRAIQKIKQAGALAEQENILNEAELDIKPGFKFFEIYDGHTMSGRGTISDIWQVTKDLGDDKFECKLVSTSGMGSTGHKKTFTKSQILKLVNPRRY